MAKNDETAYRTFYEAYCDRLLRYLLVVAAGDEDAAREVLQAALVRVVRHIKPFADERVFWSWLTVLARSAFIDHTRKRRRYLAFLDRFTRQARQENNVPEEGDAEAHLLASLERGLETLPKDERELVEQKYFARQSVHEIAAALRTTDKAVESRLVRIRRKLKAAMLAEMHTAREDLPEHPSAGPRRASLAESYNSP
jgi:RNA polymerase sigma-70 factor, ECF subfamily